MKKLLLLCLTACSPSPLISLSPDLTSVRPPEFAPHQLIVRDPGPRRLALLKQRLKAQVRDRLDTETASWLLLQFPENPTQAQIYPDLVSAWNRPELAQLEQRLPAAQWQTLMLAEDLQEQEALKPGQILLNIQGELPALPEFNDGQTSIGDPTAGWWRRETGVERAWQYALGSGVRVAWIDLGFVRQHPEIERRLRLNGRNNQTLEWGKQQPDNIEKPAGDHGLSSLLVGFAERDNRIPSVGVAPNAEVLPFVASSVWEVAQALQAAAAEKPDVIGMNFAFPMYPRWEVLKEYTQYQPLQAVIAALERSAPGVPLVLPAHNYAEPVRGGPREWFPISLAEDERYSHLIGVGGIDLAEGKTPTAWFNPDLLTGFNARGSNYGEFLIWAPATRIDIANSDPHLPWPQHMSGTSASAPLVAGALALLRSRCPKLNARQMRDLLRRTGRPLDGSRLFERPGVTVPLLQIDRALENCLGDQGLSPKQAQTREFKGILRANRQGFKFLESTEGLLRLQPSLPDLEAGVPHLLLDQPVRVWGWKQLPAWSGEALEVLALRAD